MEEEKKKRFRIIRIIIQATIILLLIGLAIYGIVKLYPIFKAIQDDESYRETVLDTIRSFNSFGWIILILAQILEVVLAIIPSGPIVIIAGMLYNPGIALLICVIGQAVGALVVIGLVKLFGYSFIALFIDPEQTTKFRLLKDGKRCGVLMFSYLLIPFLPKDPINFIVPFTKVKVRYYIAINFFARLPMTIVSVLFGNSLISGNYTLVIVIASLCAVASLLCFIFNKKIVLFIDKLTSKKNKEIVE